MNIRQRKIQRSTRLTMAYFAAKRVVLESGYSEEVDYHEELKFENVAETDFLREGAWVILSSGMRESVVRGIFPKVAQAFGEFQNAAYIAEHSSACIRRALSAFNHEGKVRAIVELAQVVAEEGFEQVRQRILKDGASYLSKFGYLGPATSLHLAKNLGLDVVKPDRHLVRLSKSAGYGCPASLCEEINRMSGERIAVVDVVLWRYATLRSDYVHSFLDAE